MTKHILSLSFGKDSLASLLLILKYRLPLDEVVFYNTGAEFTAIYKIRDKVKILLKQHNIKYVELKPKKAFFESMYNYPHKARSGDIKQGYGWCGGLCRWGTTEKIRAIDKYCENSIQYVGIAFDEPKRLKRLTPNKISILAKYQYTEKMALALCRSSGYDWIEGNVDLYDILNRVSCWCCRNKNLTELENYKKYLPEYYMKLKELEKTIGEPMKKPKYLEERFEK